MLHVTLYQKSNCSHSLGAHCFRPSRPSRHVDNQGLLAAARSRHYRITCALKTSAPPCQSFPNWGNFRRGTHIHWYPDHHVPARGAFQVSVCLEKIAGQTASPRPKTKPVHKVVKARPKPCLREILWGLSEPWHLPRQLVNSRWHNKQCAAIKIRCRLSEVRLTSNR